MSFQPATLRKMAPLDAMASSLPSDLYHHVHGGRLILASYVLPKKNEYKCFTLGPLFGSKSESCCDPTFKLAKVLLIINLVLTLATG